MAENTATEAPAKKGKLKLIIMLVIILEAIQVPTEGIALILGVDRILDMMRTVTNVTGDAAVACVIASSEGALGPPGSDA